MPPPFTAISHHAHGELFLIATPLEGGWAYRIDYPYYSWAETVVRPKIARRNLTALILELNGLEQNTSAQWRLDSAELASAAKFSDGGGKLASSSIQPDVAASCIRNFMLGKDSSRATTAA